MLSEAFSFRLVKNEADDSRFKMKKIWMKRQQDETIETVVQFLIDPDAGYCCDISVEMPLIGKHSGQEKRIG